MIPLPILLATAVLAVGQPAPKLAPETHGPLSAPPPANLSREVVLAWMAKYVRGPELTLLAYDYEGVKLVAPGGVTATPQGMVQAEVRTELFRPIEVRVGVARSGIAHWNVDCKAGRLSVLQMTIYAANNLEGEIATKISDGTEWQDPVGSEGEAIKAVCKAIGK